MAEKGRRSSQGESGGSFVEQLICEGIKRVSVAVTAVAADENGDGDSEGSSVEQQVVSSDSVICNDSSIAVAKVSLSFFRKSMSEKTTQ